MLNYLTLYFPQKYKITNVYVTYLGKFHFLSPEHLYKMLYVCVSWRVTKWAEIFLRGNEVILTSIMFFCSQQLNLRFTVTDGDQYAVSTKIFYVCLSSCVLIYFNASTGQIHSWLFLWHFYLYLLTILLWTENYLPGPKEQIKRGFWF